MSLTTFYDSGVHAEWRDIDLSILEERRAVVPAPPLGLITAPWRDWIASTASATGAPADYVLQSLLAALAGLCGAGVSVRITPAWREPMVLWQAVTGGLSTGKSAAMTSMRRLLGLLEEERRLGDEKRGEVVVGDGRLERVAEIVSRNPRGVVLWRDGPSLWLGADSEHWLPAWSAEPTLGLKSLPVSVLETVRPETLRKALAETDDGVAARFLYAWPGSQPYRTLADLALPDDEGALRRLRRISQLARSSEDPFELLVDQRGIKTFDAVLARLHAERRTADGLEAAWLGKGPATIARLAGALELLAWSATDGRGKPGHLGTEQVEAAARLWTEYFHPHARSVFDGLGPADFERRVRRAAFWLRDNRPPAVTREDIRRHALCQAVNADAADQVLDRLTSLGFVRREPVPPHQGRGRPAVRWQVNPLLAAPEEG